MGFFAEIASEARRSSPPSAPPQPAAPVPREQHASSREPLSQPIPAPAPVKPTERPETPTPAKPMEQPEPPAEPTPAPELKLDTPQDAAPAPDDTARRKAHEAAETKRQAEFDAKQAEKKAARQAALDRIAAMNGAELLAAATDRVAADTEKLTRRNMKEAVAEHIQAKCREDDAFAMLVMDPGKSMVNCFRYISRKAYEYIQDELKANGIKPGPGSGGYGCDVPDDLCYQWAEDYFKDPDVEEDHNDDEKFVPKPYVPAARKKAPAKAVKEKPEKKKPAEEKRKEEADAGQITLGGFAPMEEKAG